MDRQSEIDAVVDSGIRLNCELKGGTDENPRWGHVERDLM